MKTNFASQSGFLIPRVLLASTLGATGVFLALIAVAMTPGSGTIPGNADPFTDPLLVQPPLSPANTAAAGNWSIVASPNTSRSEHNSLVDVTCTSTSNCWAVGNYLTSNSIYQTLIERWNGSSWSRVMSPNTGATENNWLYGITCTSASDCWAVGYSYAAKIGSTYQTLIERWDGTSWSIVSSPNSTPGENSYLLSVSCTSASDCWAVGYYQGPSAQSTLIERWNGTSWAIVTSPNTSPTQDNVLAGVTCVSASDCWAVGYYYSGSAFQTLLERWNGSSWSIVTSPNTSPLQANFLLKTTCTSSSDCWAVGYTGAYQTLIERWDGNSWAIVTSVNTSASQQNFLQGVTCTSASDCWAVGYYYTGFYRQTLIQHWDGTSWAIVSSPSSSPIENNFLKAVICTSASDCWAVGYYLAGPANGIAQTLTEHYTAPEPTPTPTPTPTATPTPTPATPADWSIVSSPNAGTENNFLDHVTCVSASDCWAVGYELSPDHTYQTLIEHWDGSAWNVVDSPPRPTGTQDSYLFGVTCTSASDCWAVGQYSDGAAWQTLIERWNGSSWTIISSPNVLAQQGLLRGVACTSASDCWAVGYSYSLVYPRDGTAAQTLIERWDGTSWSIVNSANSGAGHNNAFASVTCVSASDCWAVGYHDLGANTAYQTLAEHWNGSSWSIVTSASTSTNQSNFLADVTCVSSSDCWTVGRYLSDNNTYQTVIERWDGTSWTIVSSANTSATQHNYMNGVKCVSGSYCWGVGYYQLAPGVRQTLIERWDGSSWAIVNSPNSSPAQDNILLGVTCATGFDCWAVGSAFKETAYRTLIERYTAPPVPLNSVVSRKPHGSAGTFDLNLPLTGSPGIECRSGGANRDYTMVFSFANPLSSVDGASVTSGTGTVNSSSIDSNNAHNYVVNLTDVTNAQTSTVSVTNVNDSAGNSSSLISASMAVLLGDTTADRSVNSADISQTKSQSGQSVSASNFREDVTADGAINSADISLVKSKSGTALP